ncbi:MAG TPA: acyltransferase family protein, partial [Gaiellaceae bacterium]
GLRALAVSAVVLFHLGFGWASGGLLGVGVFFTLSGYLITDLLLAQQSRRENRIGEFWLARARRLLPGLLSMLLVVAVWVALAGPAPPGFAAAVAASIFYVGNWQLIFQHVSYFARLGPPSPLGHLWSLAIEEQFYLVWPLLLLVGARLVPERPGAPGVRPRLALLTLGLAAASAVEMALLYRPTLDGSRVYFGTDTRAFELLIGAALAMVWPSRSLRGDITASARRVSDAAGTVGLVGIAILVWRTNQYTPFLYRGGFVLLTVATAALVAALVHPAARLGRILGAAPLRWVGVRSYGIYLWHMPILALTTPAAVHRIDPPRAALQVAATVVLATLSWRYLEEPIRRGALSRTRLRGWRDRRAEAPLRRRRSRMRPVAALQALGLATLASVIAVLTAASSGRHRTLAPVKPSTTTVAAAPVRHRPKPVRPSQPAVPAHTSCHAVVDIGDSTSEGLISTSYLPNPKQRIEARFDRIGATTQHYEISGARSIVETYEGQPNAVAVAVAWKRDGYHGCWVLALGTNDAANISVGSRVGPAERIERMMSLIGNRPVMWVNLKSLLSTGPYAERNMELWNQALVDACHTYPNMRVFDWNAVARDAWFIADGIHYNTPGYAARANLIAKAFARAFPAGGPSKGCVVR